MSHDCAIVLSSGKPIPLHGKGLHKTIAHQNTYLSLYTLDGNIKMGNKVCSCYYTKTIRTFILK